jgi:drug/metabolite transporter (DMT)-like permease
VARKEFFTTYPALLLSMIFWGLSFIGVKMVFEYLSPTATVFIRLVIASVFLIGLSLILKKLQKIQKKDIGMFLLLALFEPFLYYLGEGYGIMYVSPTVASIVISTIPLVVPFSMYFLAKEKIVMGNYFGILVSFAGVLLVLLKNDFSFEAEPMGVMFLLMAVSSVMGYSFVLQQLASRYNAYTIISTQNLIGVFYFLPLFLIFDVQDMAAVNWDAGLLIPLISLSIFASAIAFYLFTLGIQDIGVTKATIFTYVIPVITAIASYFIMKEEFSIRKVLGVTLTISGLFLSQLQWRKLLRIRKKPQE